MDNPCFRMQQKCGKKRYQACQRRQTLRTPAQGGVQEPFSLLASDSKSSRSKSLIIPMSSRKRATEWILVPKSAQLVRVGSARTMTFLSLTHCCAHNTATSTWRTLPAPCRYSIARAALLCKRNSILALIPMKLNAL